MRGIVTAAVLALALCCANAAFAAEAPPEFLSGYVHGDDFVPGDYAWLGWRFGSTADDRGKWTRTLDWVKARKRERMREIASRLRQSGVAGPSLKPDCYGDETCESLDEGAELAATFDSWQSFLRAREEAESYFRTYDLAARNAENAMSVDKDASLGEQLNARRVGDQIYLMATAIDPTNPPLPMSLPAVRVFRQLCWREARKRIRADTAWLKPVVEAQGWPRTTAVGREAAEMAWLIAQHSDNDPAFQLEVLRLMKPLTDSGEANAKRYAYLYDRVWLKLDGKQRYGTQFRCTGGHFEPEALEDASKVDTLRKDVGLKSLDDYAKTFPAHCENAGAK